MEVYASVFPTVLSLATLTFQARRGQRTFVTFDNSFQYITNLTAGIEIRDWIGSARIHLKSRNSSPFKSVDTPVANKPLESTARDPPRSTVAVSHGEEEEFQIFTHACNCSPMDDIKTILNPVSGIKDDGFLDKLTVCSFLMSSSKSTLPGSAAVTRIWQARNENS